MAIVSKCWAQNCPPPHPNKKEKGMIAPNNSHVPLGTPAVMSDTVLGERRIVLRRWASLFR